MKTNYILKLVLLIFLGSIVACVKPKPKEKGVEYNAYTEQIVENHLLLRDKLQKFTDSLPLYTDSSTFFEKLHPLLIEGEEHLRTSPTPISHKDSLLFAAESRVNNFYIGVIHRDFAELFKSYSGYYPQTVANYKIDSIKLAMKTEDYAARSYFNSLLDSSIQQLPPLLK